MGYFKPKPFHGVTARPVVHFCNLLSHIKYAMTPVHAPAANTPTTTSAPTSSTLFPTVNSPTVPEATPNMSNTNLENLDVLGAGEDEELELHDEV